MNLTTAQTHLDAWLKADLAVSKGQSYSISTESGSRSLSRADAAFIREQIGYWSRQVADLKAAAAGASNSRVSFAKFS